MKPITLIVVLAIALSGCTFSVHPILKERDLTKDVDLSGTWKQQVPPDAKPEFTPIEVSLEGYDDNSLYDAEYKNTAQEFDVRIGRIGDRRVVQFIRSDLLLRNESPVLARLPVYGFARFEMKDKELHLFPVHDQGVRKLLQRNDVAFRNYHPSDMLEWCIISDRTSVLQKLIHDHGDDLFKKTPAVFRRVKKQHDAGNQQSHVAEPAASPISDGESSPPTG